MQSHPQSDEDEGGHRGLFAPHHGGHGSLRGAACGWVWVSGFGCRVYTFHKGKSASVARVKLGTLPYFLKFYYVSTPFLGKKNALAADLS